MAEQPPGNNRQEPPAVPYSRVYGARCFNRGERDLQELLEDTGLSPAASTASEHYARDTACGAASWPLRGPEPHGQRSAGRAHRCSASSCTVSIQDLSQEMSRVATGPYAHLDKPCNLPHGPKGTIELYPNGCDERSNAKDGFISVFLVASTDTALCLCGARITFSLRGRTPSGEPKHAKCTRTAPSFGRDLNDNGIVKEGKFNFVRRSEVVLESISITVHVECCADGTTP